jgi:hypothetical protein
MVKSNEDLEAYFAKLDRRYEMLDDGTFLVAVASRRPPIAVRLLPPVVVLQVKIGDVASTDVGVEATLYRRLLELNAHDLMHASYGLDGDSIVLSAALEADTLDLNELEATLADMGMALSEHVQQLREIVGQPESKQD